MIDRPTLSLLTASLVVLAALACGERAGGETAMQDAMNELSHSEREAGWRLLFDGRTTGGWRGFRQDAMPAGWQVVDGALTRVAEAGDIVTVDEFGDFELKLEWKVEAGGNSGIFFRVTEDAGATYESGPEMQVLDDERHVDGQSPLTSAGSNYGLHPAPEGVVKPAGGWNQVRLLVDGAHVEHWLNGQKVVEYELWTPEWEALVADSKFAQWPGYGRAERGHIALQDHGDRVAFRNIKIRPIQ